jgi:hypothetical protein
MKNLLLLFATILLLSCNKSNTDNPLNTDLPQCIAELIEDTSLVPIIQTVKQQQIDDAFHYWLNTDAVHYDGAEYIVNATCDTLCYYCGECLFPVCTDVYNNDDWQIIWTP